LKTTTLSLALAGLALCATAPAAAASDLTIDGQTSAIKAMGSAMTVAITGTPGSTTYLLIGVDPGPSVLFGNTVDIGFAPPPIIADVGIMPVDGVLSFNAVTPSGSALDGLTVYMIAVVADGVDPPDYDYSPGAKFTIVDRATELAGNALGSYPFFEYVRAFNQGSPVSLAVDPGRIPALVGVTADVYVVVSKDVPGWEADATLTDVTGDGANTVTFVAGTIQANTIIVDTGTLSGDAGAGLGVGYDMIIDTNQDGKLDDGDLIDGFEDESGLYVVHDVTLPGPYTVIETLYTGGGFLTQDLYYPSNILSLGRLPLVIVSHGNGHNYQWYDHIGEHLASYGFVVMSHQNNTVPGIETASTTTLTNTDYLLNNLTTIAGGVLNQHLDTNNITWIGHSRGGEGVARAYDRIIDGTYIPNNYVASDIRLISSIAPTDFLGPNSANPHGVDYHLWTGGSDADVNGCANCDICQTFHLHDRAQRKRMSISLHGVGHGDFHDGGGSSVASGPCLVGRPTTHRIMRGYLLPLVMHHSLGNIPAEDFLWRQWESFQPVGAPATNPCVVVDLQYRDGTGKFVIDDFQSQPGVGVSSSGGGVTGTVQGLTEGRLDDENSVFTNTTQPFNSFTGGAASDSTAGIVFEFDGVFDRTLTFTLPAAGQNATKWTYLSFRAAQASRDNLTIAALGDLTFTATLVDNAAVSSTIGIGAFGGGIEEPYQRTGCGSGAGWAAEFETVRIRLTDFLNNGSGIDLASLDKITFTFGPGAGSTFGRLGFDDLEFTTD
jgi:hypothetical protein